ncbi:ribonuclease III [Candidatus Finniella inopinata]|uniref:Ribonuclease 3 n=1 Tax=Candidatus Finniella inopinata TaxID=1696036 RepID=A0A4V2DZJ4_9PROT|nr:ribonuclease III [Candidatus Finniella inopinata]RZI45267.1 ribonuclease III [Candidatus Finniella inopinata]
MERLQDLEKKIGHVFRNKNLLEAALTHSSIRPGGKDFERLEFLGDRVLELVVAEQLYLYFTKEKEGDLAKRLAGLVCREACEKVGQELELSNFIMLNGAELGPRSAILSDAVEALLGAMYLDGGLTPCNHFIKLYWTDLRNKTLSPPKDPKTTLQEWAQTHEKAVPTYELIETTGPDHAPTFLVQVHVLNHAPVKGNGTSKRQAEQNAALNFMENIPVRHGKSL